MARPWCLAVVPKEAYRGLVLQNEAAGKCSLRGQASQLPCMNRQGVRVLVGAPLHWPGAGLSDVAAKPELQNLKVPPTSKAGLGCEGSQILRWER